MLRNELVETTITKETKLDINEGLKKLEEVDLISKDNIESLNKNTAYIQGIIKCIHYFQEMNVQFKQEHYNTLIKNTQFVNDLAEAFSQLKLYFSFEGEIYINHILNNISSEVSYIPKGIFLLKVDDLLNNKTIDFICKHPSVHTALNILGFAGATKDIKNHLLQTSYTSDEYKKIGSIFRTLFHFNLCKEKNINFIFEFDYCIDEVSNIIDSYNPDLKNKKKLTQEYYDSIVSNIREREQKRTQEIKETLCPKQLSEFNNRGRDLQLPLQFFAKPDTRLIPEEGVVDIICNYR